MPFVHCRTLPGSAWHGPTASCRPDDLGPYVVAVLGGVTRYLDQKEMPEGWEVGRLTEWQQGYLWDLAE